MKRPGDWLGYSADTSEADVPRLAAKALEVPEDAVEVKRTGGCWLTRERCKGEQDEPTGNDR